MRVDHFKYHDVLSYASQMKEIENKNDHMKSLQF